MLNDIILTSCHGKVLEDVSRKVWRKVQRKVQSVKTWSGAGDILVVLLPSCTEQRIPEMGFRRIQEVRNWVEK